MNNKIHKVAEKMIESSKSISDITKADHSTEYYFQFPTGTFWSIAGWKDNHSLYLYPHYGGGGTDTLSKAEFDPTNSDAVPFIVYSTKEDQELTGVLSNLFRTVQSRFLGADDILDDILNSDV